MITFGRPKFEVIVGATADERRLLSAATVRSFTGLAEDDVSDETLDLMIDAALAQCARSCKLASYRGVPLTLARESVRATWLASGWYYPGIIARPPLAWEQPSQLILPWRSPVTSVASVTEGETNLVEDVDFRLLGAGVLERIDAAWATSGTIVVDYVAGFVPLVDYPEYQEDGATLPPDLVQMIANQVSIAHYQRGHDLNIRSEDIPNVWSGSYNVPGGDAVNTDGLMRPLWEALAPYRGPPTIA
jgi:hypothetical protein